MEVSNEKQVGMWEKPLLVRTMWSSHSWLCGDEWDAVATLLEVHKTPEQDRGMEFLQPYHLHFSHLRWMGNPESPPRILGTMCRALFILFPQYNRDITEILPVSGSGLFVPIPPWLSSVPKKQGRNPQEENSALFTE